MNKLSILLILLILYGCSGQKLDGSVSNSISYAPGKFCSEKLSGVLDKKDVKTIPLSSSNVKESGQVSADKYVGYAFQGKAGQRISYRTNDNICVSVFTPKNEVLKGVDLDTDGQYILQVAVPKGSTSFNLEMSLGIGTLSQNQSVQSQPSFDIIGNWEGSFGLNSKENSTISITKQSGKSFQGILYTVGNKGGKFSIAIEGEIKSESRETIIQEFEILSKPANESWFLGVNKGNFSSDYRQLSGTGQDPHGNRYDWAFYKK